ncbi:MAG: right-handed parallel beta-helix repeat-containing protein [Kofleriaceae bacterium]
MTYARFQLAFVSLGLAVLTACDGGEVTSDDPDVSPSVSLATIPGCDGNAPPPALGPDPRGRDLFVHPTGKRCGSAGSRPYATVQDAVNCSRPGDRIYLKAGDYKELKIVDYRPDLARPGRVPRHLYISGEPGARIVIDPKAPLADWTSIVAIENSSYITLANLVVTNSALDQEVANKIGSVGIAIGGDKTPSHHISLHKVEVTGVARHAVTVNGGNSFHLESNHFHHVAMLNKNKKLKPHDGGVATSRKDDTSCFKATWNLIHDVFGECLVAQRVSGGLLEGNEVYNCFSVNIYLDSSENVQVSRNYVYANDPASEYFREGKAAIGLAIAKETAEGYPARNHEITNNAFHHLAIGIYYGHWEYTGADNYYSGIRIAHNVIKEMALISLGVEVPWSDQPGLNRIENNIIFKPWDPEGSAVQLDIKPPMDETGWPTPAWEVSHNLFPNGVPGTRGDDGTNLAGDPLFVPFDGPTHDIDRFKIDPDSRAAGAGRATPVAKDYWYAPRNATAPSIGIHEPAQ